MYLPHTSNVLHAGRPWRAPSPRFITLLGWLSSLDDPGTELIYHYLIFFKQTCFFAIVVALRPPCSQIFSLPQLLRPTLKLQSYLDASAGRECEFEYICHQAFMGDYNKQQPLKMKYAQAILHSTGSSPGLHAPDYRSGVKCSSAGSNPTPYADFAIHCP